MFKRMLAVQARKPGGFFGGIVVRVMSRATRASNDWTVSMMNIQPTDHVLELGFGAGKSIQHASGIATNGFVAGVDFSELMVRQASKLNAQAIKSGRVELKYGEATAIPYEDASFAKVFAVNVIYLWPDLATVIKEVRRVLTSGGQIGLYLAPIEQVERLGFFNYKDIFTIHTADDVKQKLSEAGFAGIHEETASLDGGTGRLFLAQK